MKIEIKSVFGAVLFEFDGSNLRDAVIAAVKKRANLREANLYGADLYGANLYEANLYGANLYEAHLREANLYGADLREANLYGADLRGANLREANLYGANLYEAHLREAKNLDVPLNCPKVGTFTAFKKCQGRRIVTLVIPEDAKRSSATSRKCRADKAMVIKIDDGKNEFESAKSQREGTFIYKVGQEVSVDNFCEDRFRECAAGIHFFITRREAEEY